MSLNSRLGSNKKEKQQRDRRRWHVQPGFRVEGLGFEVWSLEVGWGFGVWDVGFAVWVSGFGVSGVGCGVWGLGLVLGVRGLGCGV